MAVSGSGGDCGGRGKRRSDYRTDFEVKLTGVWTVLLTTAAARSCSLTSKCTELADVSCPPTDSPPAGHMK